MEYIPAAASGFVPASHEDPRHPGVLKRVIADKPMFQSGHVQMLNWARLPAGSSFRRHYHEDMQEVFVLIRGVVRMTGDALTVEMTPGDTVLVQPGEVHQMHNDGSEDAEYIVFGISSGRGGQTVVIDERASISR